MAPNKFGTIQRSAGLERIMTVLTSPEVIKLSGGYFPKPLTLNQAAGLVGSLTAEHGKLDWKGLDVVEKGTAVGRGMAQWSYDRRRGYDQARSTALKSGKDPNGIDFQLQYFFDELRGKYDKNGASLIGYRQPGTLPANWKGQDNPAAWADYWTGSLAEKRGYFMPRTPHKDKRVNFADQIFRLWQDPKPQAQPKGQPKGQGKDNWLQDTLNKLGIKGGNQSFDMNKLQKNLGSIAANTPVSDVGFAIFASQKGVGNASKAWNKLDNNTKRAYGRAGGQLAINSNPGYYAANQAGGSQQTYKMPKNLSIGSGSQNYAKDSKIDFDRNKTQSGGSRSIGGLPGLNDIAQAGIANYGNFKDKGAGYGAAAYGMSNSTVGRINSQSYSSKMDLGRSLGINTGATSAAGSRYGGAAMSSSWNAGATAAAGYGYSK